MWNALGFVSGIVILLVTTPIYIRLLGLEQFGIFSLLLSVTAPLGILNAGVAQATTKYVADQLAGKRVGQAERILHTSLLLNLAVGMLGCVCLWLASPWAAGRVFKIPGGLVSEAIVAFRLTAFVWLLGQIVGTYQAAVMGWEDFRTLTIGRLIQQVASYGLGAVVLLLRPKVSTLMWLNLVVNGALVLYWHRQAHRSLPGLRLVPVWDMAAARQTQGFSLWQVLNSVFTTASLHADRLLLAALTSTAAVGVYGVAMNVQGRTVGLVWSLLGVLFPAASAVSQQPGHSEKLILDYGWRISVLGGTIYASLFVLGPDFLHLWLGADIGRQASPVLLVLLAAALLGLPSAVMFQYLWGNALTKWSTLSNILTSIISLALTVILVKQFGLLGAAWGGLLALALTRPVFHLWVIRRRFLQLQSAWASVRMLYGILFSACFAAVVATIVHSQLILWLGRIPGFVTSALVTPTIVLVLILLVERFLLAHPQPTQELVASLKYRLKTLRSLPAPGLSGSTASK